MVPAAKPFKDQKYHELKKQCIHGRQLFEDPEFPAKDESLFFSRPLPGKVQWKRPKELCEDPRLFVDGISSHDLHQGKLGNCWFVAACSCLALRQSLWTKVIPKATEQEWNPRRPECYAGIFHFRFWCFGEWVDVVVDDLLPTIHGELIFCHSNVQNEFWSALLEKAYAKLAGCYEALDGGSTVDALVDFSGGLAESIDLRKGRYCEHITEQTKLFEDLLKAHGRGGLISCSILPLSPTDREVETAQGLVKGHAYSVTDVRKVRLGDRLLAIFRAEKLFMVRMRNPWGRREWSGPWSDDSEEWQRVSRAERASLGLTVADDGEFWMAFEDWCSHFTDVDICHNVNTSFFSLHKTWEQAVVRGAWIPHQEPLRNRAGGCFNNRDTFLQNPQYIFDIKKAQDQVLISLQQRDQRVHRKEGYGDNLTIGFSLFKVEENRRFRMHHVHIQEHTSTSMYADVRAVFLRKLLPRGRYVLIPTTFQPGDASTFLLRLFTDEPACFRELKLDKPKVTCWSLLCGFPRGVTQVVVRSAGGLVPRGRAGGADPYVVIRCGGEQVRSTVQRNTVDAVFNTQAIFYRKDFKGPLVVQVWNSNLLCDQLLGQVVLAATPDAPREEQTLPLQGQGRGQAASGHVTLRVVSSDSLLEL
ncbi:calpain-6 [Ornithorhynchus anatinus]|uniref:Calpain 6 n=1 Tax=Ornithorhynchus anatinus TaxID=9258 RepID=F7BAV6_ORNAN|nr:calpain-6 [Ornithorhynchus anatinus]XP_028923377.1 calpain-6 [Ornithorhynchus anatinus]